MAARSLSGRHSRRHWLAAALALGGGFGTLRAQPAAPAAVAPPELATDLPGARLQGQGRLSFLGLHIYDARLWVGPKPATAAGWPTQTLALELAYARSVKGRTIAERTLAEMQRLAPVSEERAKGWLAAMLQLFPDLQGGDRITGLQLPGYGARFFVNGALRGDLRDTEFTPLFFGIWLSEKTREAALREGLLGRSA